MSAKAQTRTYETRPRPDKRGFDLISDAIEYAEFYSRSRDAIICVYDHAGNMIETHEHDGDSKEW